MTLGLSAAIANDILDALGNNSSLTTIPVATGLFAKLHVGDPGSAGTANPATETTRQAVSFGAPSGGSMANDAAVTWTSIAGSQDATHFSCWDDATAGTFILSGTITANAYTAGDTYTVAIGAMTVSLLTAA